jgi:hypothetical protein
MPCYLKEIEELGIRLSQEEREELERDLREAFGAELDLCEATHDPFLEGMIKDYVMEWVRRRRRLKAEEREETKAVASYC